MKRFLRWLAPLLALALLSACGSTPERPDLARLYESQTQNDRQPPVVLIHGLMGSTLVFCAAHLPTYDWNWAQCFGVIGASRIVLTLAYILTRNLWVSTGAHVLTDWTELAIAFAVAPRVH